MKPVTMHEPAELDSEEYEDLDLSPEDLARLQQASDYVDRGLPCKPLTQARAEIRARLVAAFPRP